MYISEMVIALATKNLCCFAQIFELVAHCLHSKHRPMLYRMLPVFVMVLHNLMVYITVVVLLGAEKTTAFSGGVINGKKSNADQKENVGRDQKGR